MANSSVVSVLALLLVLSGMYNVEGLKTFYYAKTCPGAEAKVTGIVAKAVFQNRRVGAQLIRLLFHDCFVQVRQSVPLYQRSPVLIARRPVVFI